MNTLNQIVTQINTGPYKRALVQYTNESNEDIFSPNQVEVVYSTLTTDEKSIFDSFLTLMNSKIPS